MAANTKKKSRDNVNRKGRAPSPVSETVKYISPSSKTKVGGGSRKKKATKAPSRTAEELLSFDLPSSLSVVPPESQKDTASLVVAVAGKRELSESESPPLPPKPHPEAPPLLLPIDIEAAIHSDKDSAEQIEPWTTAHPDHSLHKTKRSPRIGSHGPAVLSLQLREEEEEGARGYVAGTDGSGVVAAEGAVVAATKASESNVKMDQRASADEVERTPRGSFVPKADVYGIVVPPRPSAPPPAPPQNVRRLPLLFFFLWLLYMYPSHHIAHQFHQEEEDVEEEEPPVDTDPATTSYISPEEARLLAEAKAVIAESGSSGSASNSTPKGSKKKKDNPWRASLKKAEDRVSQVANSVSKPRVFSKKSGEKGTE